MTTVIFSTRSLLVLSLLVAACGGAREETTTTTTTTTADTSEPASSNDETSTSGHDGPEPMVGATCGSRGLAPCPADQFCDFPDGSQCGATDRGGSCRARPEMCTREYAPVCGCDGQTHPTACVAHSQGVSVAHGGPC